MVTKLKKNGYEYLNIMATFLEIQHYDKDKVDLREKKILNYKLVIQVSQQSLIKSLRMREKVKWDEVDK